MRADIAVVLGVLCCAAVARADPEAKRLFDEGRELLDRGKVDEACRRFAQSLERERAGGTMLNLADCAERAGQFARAWSLYDEAAREYERTNKGTAERFARGRATALEPKLATVIVRVAEPDTRGLVVTIDEDDVAPIAKILRFHDPGSLTITARAPGRVRFATTIEAAAGQKVTVDVPDLERRARERDEPEPTGPKHPASRGDPWRVVLWTSMGAGAAGGVVWLYGWRQIVDAEQNLEVGVGDRDRYISQGSRGRTLSYVGAGVLTASVVGVGISLYMGAARARSSDRAARAAAPVLAPVLSASAIGVAMTAGF
jgi:hypothetical protein